MARSFLITFKPALEYPKRGWPLEELLKLVKRFSNGEPVQEDWRFANRTKANLGDRVFLLLQGKGGPAIIGYGSIVGTPNNSSGSWHMPISFESLLDPSKEALAIKDDLLGIKDGENLWRTQSSGVLIPEDTSAELERLVVGGKPKVITQTSSINPDWQRDELIIALSVYLKYRPNSPGKDSHEIVELSRVLNRLGEKLFPVEERSVTFRNVNGVYMKLMNFRRLDPQYTAEGRVGLSRGAKGEKEVWDEFSDSPELCQKVADAIIASLSDPEISMPWLESNISEDVQEAPEGRLLTRKHLVRERNQKLTKSKRDQARKRHGKLACEVCDFDFLAYYGSHGDGFIECHHTTPVSEYSSEQNTHIDDLALVCANRHRMIHRSKPWLDIDKLKELVRMAQKTA